MEDARRRMIRDAGKEVQGGRCSEKDVGGRCHEGGAGRNARWRCRVGKVP